MIAIYRNALEVQLNPAAIKLTRQADYLVTEGTLLLQKQQTVGLGGT